MYKQFISSARLLPFASLALILFSACKKEDKNDPNPNQQEVITTLSLALTDSAGGTSSICRFYDADGDGGIQGTADTIRLLANRTYYASITLLDESTTPADTISKEVRAEANEHQFFFNSSIAALKVRYDPKDYDTNMPPKPVGLQTIWQAGLAQTASLLIVLKHQPDIKSKINNTTGDQTKGETDILVNFPVVVR